jgi:hypothetical protein
MHKLSLSLLLVILCCPKLISGQTTHDNRFPFMAWDYVDSARILKSMHDAGITSVAFVPARMLDACEKFNLKCILFDERLAVTQWDKPFDGDRFTRNLASIVREVGNKPALYGFHVKDEPDETDFRELAKAVAAVKKLAPGKWPYINLLPGEGASYNHYVEQFIDVVSPTALSYDRYSIVGDTGSGKLDPLFWSNLEQIREIAKQHHLPFWNIVLTSPHGGYRKLTKADLRLQVWGSLAYGAGGIAYYKFISKELPILDAPDLGNFRDGPLNEFGEKTPTWTWLRDTDREIQNIAPVYLTLHSDDTYHIGIVPKENHGPSAASLVKDIPNGNFVVGDFTGANGRRFVIIVNKSLKQSAPCAPQFTTTPKEVLYVSPTTGDIKPFRAQFYWLAPGQGVLLEVLQ